MGTSFASIAAQTSLSENHVTRILRHAMTRHIFREPAPGFVAHTAASALLSRDSVTRDVVGLITDEMWPAGLKVPEALARWPNSQEPEETGFSMANAQGPEEQKKSMWSVFEEDAERARRFGVCMSVENSAMPFPLEELEWQGLVVDIGGGVGFNAFNLAEKHQNARFIVEDLSKTVQQGRLLLPKQLKDRVDFMEHDFFSPQPVKDADIYFFRRIFHDWSDKHAVEIIRSLIPALKPGARVRVNELLVPKPGELPREIEKMARNSDFAMLALLNGKERNNEEWQALFRAASDKFRFGFCKITPPGLMAVIEFIWEP
ncbi:hypothetical protein AA0121_g13321 [Alternaria tenuissima]|nr:hypothetical protein AA0121_g13321 [Alternaria tenuissima]